MGPPMHGQIPTQIDLNGNVIKTEQPSQEQMMKPEQYMNYGVDPMYGYYAQMGMAPQLPMPQQNEDKQAVMQQSLSTSTMWDSMQEQQMQIGIAKEEKTDDNSDNNVLVPKQEPVWPDAHAAHAQAMQMNQYYDQMNMYYANQQNVNGYYPQYYNPMNPPQQPNGDEMNKNIEVPPMPMPLMEMDTNSYEK